MCSETKLNMSDKPNHDPSSETRGATGFLIQTAGTALLFASGLAGTFSVCFLFFGPLNEVVIKTGMVSVLAGAIAIGLIGWGNTFDPPPAPGFSMRLTGSMLMAVGAIWAVLSGLGTALFVASMSGNLLFGLVGALPFVGVGVLLWLTGRLVLARAK